jgi:hypothetical protein
LGWGNDQVLGRPKRKADNFWKVAIKSEVMRKFGEQSLTTEERGEYYDLRRKVTMCRILLRIQVPHPPPCVVVVVVVVLRCGCG